MTTTTTEQIAAAPVAGCLVHPNYVLRVAGEPAALLAVLETGETAQAWNERLALQRAIAQAGPALCARLQALVPMLDDKAATRAALEMRRAIHNGKAFKPEHPRRLASHLDEAQISELEAVNDKLLRIGALRAELLAAHERELAHGTAAISALARASNLRAALSYGNPDFLALLQRHFAGGRQADAKALRNLEDSLLQFYARSSTKTSPLSSFTVAQVAEWRGDDAAPSIELEPQLARRVEIKAALLRHLLEPMLGSYATVSRAFPLALNPSLRSVGGRLRFTKATSGQEFIARTWGTGIDLTHLDRSPILSCIAHVYERHGGRALLAATLCQEVCSLAPKLPPASVAALVEKLFGLGFLIADTGFHEQQDLLDWAEQICRERDLPAAPEIATVVCATRASLEAMQTDDVEARTAAVRDVRRHMDELAQLTGADRAAGRFKAPFYENCYLGRGSGGFSTAWLGRYGAELDLMQDLSCVLDPNQEVHLRLCDYFVARFGEEGCCQDVSGFLEDFDRIYTPGVIDGKIDEDNRAADSPRTAAWLRAKTAIFEFLERRFREGRDTALDPDELRGLLSLMPPRLLSRSVSYSYLVQVAQLDGEERLVLNQVFGGRSSILSRFCEVLDADGLARLGAYLDAGSDQRRRAELGGVFGFNANRHPATCDVEVVVPPFAPSFVGSTQLRLDQLQLRYSPQTHRLVFHDPGGAPLDLFYQGLLNPALLPQIQRILALAFTEGPSLTIGSSLSRLSRSLGEQVIYAPRITLGRLVISRRTWLVPHALCPDANVPAAEFYLAVREWQQRHGLPQRLFVRAVPLQPVSGDEEAPSLRESLKDVNFKDMKPFYVDLGSPRFVRLLQNMMKRHQLTVCATELLPDFGDHPTRMAGQTHVSELHFELTRPARAQLRSEPGWHVIRIAYFDDRRALMLGPVRAVMELARAKHAIRQAFIAPHWKFGPHIDLVFHADPEVFHLALFPQAQRLLAGWLQEHPSRTVIDPAQYEETSRRIAVFEIEPGPYLPLLRNNTVSAVPYTRAKTVVLPQIAQSKEQLLSDSLDLQLALYERNEHDKDAVFLALYAMLAATADTPQGGMAAGYMSMRSHADYFFAVHDTSGALRRRFDEIDARHQAELDAITRAVASKAPAQMPLAPELQRLVCEWLTAVRAANERHQQIVAEHYEALVSQTLHVDMARQMQREDPSEFRERIASRRISEIGDAFLNSEAGRARLRRPEFLTYRLTVNLYYALLPVLEVAPVQKFLLCHLLSNSVERVFQQSWRRKIERVRSEAV